MTTLPPAVQITAELIESFSGLYLSSRYDSPQPTPQFHRECWKRYCSPVLAAATAAPRKHAKSTALTHDYCLATVLFRAESYIILIGATEEMAIEHLGDIKNELSENEELIRDFRVKGFVTEQKTDVIVECEDGYQFRIIARGAEQKIRGRKWKGRRPGLIICDDLEDDEQVENADRRRKFRKWFFRAAKQSLREGGKIRVHGTILHEDSLLMRLMKNKQWDARLYKAHSSFDEFTQILWEEQFSAERLKAIRQEFIDEGDSAGYAQEYLNDPLDYSDKYLQKSDFIPITEEDHEKFKRFNVGVDFAISTADSANRTSFTIGGSCTSNLLHVVDQRVARLNSLGIVEEFFSVNSRWSPDMFFVEDGQIWKAIRPILEREMQIRDIWIPYTAILPVKDKAVRGRSLQKRMRSGGCRFDKDAEWYPVYEEELLRFTGQSEALLDDQFDSTAILARGIETVAMVEDEDVLDDEELAWLAQSRVLREQSGRSQVTGY